MGDLMLECPHKSFMHFQKYLIQSPLLAGALGYRIDTSNLGSPFQRGIADQRSAGDGYRFLIYLLRQAIGHSRYPGHEDRNLLKFNAHNDRKIYAGIKPDDIVEAAKQLRAAYEHTQNVLSTAFPEGRITLVRGLRDKYANYVASAKFVALSKGKARVSFLVDQVESYSFLDSPNSGYTDATSRQMNIHLRRSVPIEDVLLTTFTVSSLGCKSTVEEGEWLVVNPSPQGRCVVGIDEIVVPERFVEQLAEWHDPSPFRFSDDRYAAAMQAGELVAKEVQDYDTLYIDYYLGTNYRAPRLKEPWLATRLLQRLNDLIAKPTHERMEP